MPITAGEIRAQMTLDTAGVAQGVAQAQTSLNTLTAAGEQVANAVGSAEARITSSASSIAAAMNEAGGSGIQLAQLAARADQAGARVDVLAQRAEAMAKRLADAQQAAADSGEALAELQDSAAASAENLAQAQQALEELKASGTASAEAMREAQEAVDEFSTESADLNNQVEQLTTAHEANNAAVAEADAKYRQLIAQLNGAQAAADAAGLKFNSLTESLSSVDAGGLSGITSTLTQLGTSTMIRASRSLGTIAAGAMGLNSSSVVGVLASRTMSTTLMTLVRTLGLAKFGLIGAGAAALYAGYQLYKASQDVEDSTDRWERLYQATDATSHIDYKTVVNADIELDTTGLADNVQSVYKQIGDALTDGKPDTAAVISEIQGSAQQMFTDVRQRIQTWYDTEMAGLDLSTSSGLKKAEELTGKYNGLMDRVDQLDDSTAAWIASYAGKSTAECTAALKQLETYEQELERLAKRADEQAALATSTQRAAYTAATNGLTTDETTVANATQYVKFRYAMDLQNVNDDADADAAKLWAEYQEKLINAASDQEQLELKAEYELKLEENESDRQAEIARLRDEYQQGLSMILQGVAEAAQRSDPELAAAIQDAITGNFKSLGQLDLDNSALVNAIRGMVEAGLFEGFTDVDLSTTEGQMRQLIAMLQYGMGDALNEVTEAWDKPILSTPTIFGIIDADADKAVAKLREWAQGVNAAVDQGDPERVRAYVRTLAEAMNPPGVEWSNGESYLDHATAAFASLLNSDLNPDMLQSYTGALSDMLTVVRQMDANNPEDYAFLDALAQSLSAQGIAAEAENAADALQWLYESATGETLGEPVKIGAEVQLEPQGVELPSPEELGFGDTPEASPNTIPLTLPAEVEVEPQVVELPSPEELGFGDEPEASPYTIPLTLPAEVTVEPQGNMITFGELPDDGFEWPATDTAPLTVSAEVAVEPQVVELPIPEELGFGDEPEASPYTIPLTLPAEVTVEPQSTALPGGFEWASVLPGPEESGMGEYGESLSAEAIRGMLDKAGEAGSSARAVADAAAGGLNGASGEFAAAGDNAGDAFVSALRGHIEAAAAAATAIGSAAYNALKASLDIHSPSRKMRALGNNSGEAYALGIDDKVLLAKQSMQRLAGGALAGAAAGVTNNDQRSWTNNINNPVVRGHEDLRRMSRGLARLTAEGCYGIT